MAERADPAAASKEAQKRIAAAKRDGATELDLRELGLTTLPPEIGSLTALQKLDIGFNQLTTLPPEIGSLTALQAIKLSGNQLTTLPPEIGSLTALNEIHLNSTGITSLPSEIGLLSALRTLNVAYNLLVALPPEIGLLTQLNFIFAEGNRLASLPPQIQSLTALSFFQLDDNKLSTLPPEIGSLTALQTLNLSSNRLRTLPPEVGSLTELQRLDLSGNLITSLPPEIKGCGNLRELYLHGNERLKIPQSFLGPTHSDVSTNRNLKPARPNDLINFCLQIETGAEQRTLQAVKEVKVMLVGRGGAGKTSLRRFFLGQPHDTKEPETAGIALNEFDLPCHRSSITVHLWDFAGQEITHALHQFFLTEGCVYILALDPRSNTEMTDAFYWLDQLKCYAPLSPVIIALNRQDSRKDGYDVDRDLLRERYPQTVDFVKTNCETRSGCIDLRASLTQAIEKLSDREPPRLKVPGNWLKVKDECWTIAGGKKAPTKSMLQKITAGLIGAAPAEHGRHTMTFKQFREICARHEVTKLDQQESLARLLHKLGSVLHFVDDPRLRDTSVLNPHWVTDGVYRLLRYKDRPGSDGILSITEAMEALEGAAEDSARYLLGLMERFEMCFPVEEDAAKPARWLIPGSLNPYQPEGLGKSWQGPGAVRLRYDYGSPVAEGILARFIVLTHPLRGEAVWRNGVVLRDGDAAAMIRRGEKQSYIEVAAFGPEAARLGLLELIQGTMARVNADLPGNPPIVEQEVDGLPGGIRGVYRSIADLKAAEVTDKPIVIGATPPPVLVEATPQLNRASQPSSRDPTRVPLRTFLSYSHENRRLKSLLAQNLNVMQGRNLVATWHDGMIDAGKDWKREITEQLDCMDLFVGLLTTSFLESTFIQTVELHAARKRLIDREKRDFLFVLIVAEDNLSIGGLDLAQYELLYPGSKSISQFPNQRAFFNQAQKEIEVLISKHRFRRDDEDGEKRTRIDPPPRTPNSGGEGVTVIVSGNYIQGDMRMTDDHSIKIGGDVINSQVAQTLTNSTNMIQQQAPGERKTLLDELRRDVEELLKHLPQDKKDEAPQVAENLEMLVKQATSEKPNRKWYSVSAEGLLEASKWTNDFAGNIFGTIGQLGKLIWQDYSSPKAD